jgi:hypothetical protein
VDGWECATAYEEVLQRIDDEVPTFAFPSEVGWAWVSHPLTPLLAEHHYHQDEAKRKLYLIAFMVAGISLAPEIEDE